MLTCKHTFTCTVYSPRGKVVSASACNPEFLPRLYTRIKKVIFIRIHTESYFLYPSSITTCGNINFLVSVILTILCFSATRISWLLTIVSGAERIDAFCGLGQKLNGNRNGWYTFVCYIIAIVLWPYTRNAVYSGFNRFWELSVVVAQCLERLPLDLKIRLKAGCCPF